MSVLDCVREREEYIEGGVERVVHYNERHGKERNSLDLDLARHVNTYTYT